MGPCLSTPAHSPLRPQTFALVTDRACDADYAFNPRVDKLGEGAQVRVRRGRGVGVKGLHGVEYGGGRWEGRSKGDAVRVFRVQG
jgi:hypothetical protein